MTFSPSAVKISFVETAPPEREFFQKEFAAHELRFCHSLAEVAADTEILSVFIDSKIDADFLEKHPAVRLIATRSTTYDHINLTVCAQRGVTVRGVASYGDYTVTEHTFALILTLTRSMGEAMAANTRRTFSYAALRSTELHGKTFGVVGAGRIGRQTLRLARAFGMETIAFDLNADSAAASEIGFAYVGFDELLRRSHIISLNLPLTAESYHLFDRETFAKCRPGVIIINTARGRLIDTEALIEALDAGIVGGAGLDVLEDERVMRKKASLIISEQIIENLSGSFAPVEPLVPSVARANEVRQLMKNSDLLARPNVVFTPHIAFNSIEAIERINQTTAENIRTFLVRPPKRPAVKKQRRVV